ncbi:Dolichyl-phosphate beta-D-mannosyltransferase [Acidimicrobium ferrooxidans DSM 10331]|uniref:Dolichyl-phosphate beta-D-mannosyltransferase n=1 Tax=Acidimicrobium ferrooxidans (strain DSM 10331 / JCM 15462 / NBRC 103882 / ICP) TaxID=525909 RepID=C7LYK1_ACIFD|nr:polyprenol monophosphomannose synthase [Acidimicrobium ferrooxidans]ACU53809.1 Dolichyl-phosphate beta-D-mannosyltransferase [Acidimicrobium ferrooxidans DSM 10331]
MEEVPSSRPWVVIPTYNEVDNIGPMLGAVLAAVPEAHVLVVDDGSPDGTAAAVRAVSERDERVRLLAREQKTGLGGAYRDGFKVAISEGATSVVEIDADFSHDPAAIPALLAALDDGAALAIGSRYVLGGRSPGLSRERLALSRGGNLYAAFMLGLPVRDATAGFRAYRTDVIHEVGFRSSRADGYGFQVELTRLVNDAGYRIVEIPITFRDRRAGTSKMSAKIVVEAMVLCTIWGIGRRFPWLNEQRQEALIDRLGAVVDRGARLWSTRR